MRYLIPLLVAFLSNAQMRPPITGVATFAVKVGDMDEARKFYSDILGYDEIFVSKATGGTVFKVNDHQYVELSTGLKGDEDRLSFIGLETADARKLAVYLASKGIEAPATLAPDADGNLSFTVHDPNGHAVRFVQYRPGSEHSRLFGQHLSARRTSERIIHVGVHVTDRAAADRFYVDILECRLLWEGGPATNPHAWISVMLPEGSDWIEYMTTPNANVRQLGSMHHMALGVPDIQTPYRTITERGYKGLKPTLARDGRWLLNTFDPYHTRTEFMVRKPVITPCCTPLHDPTIQTSARTTDLYFIDVESGHAVLVVTPNGKSMLLGSVPEAYAARLQAVLQEAGIKQLDYTTPKDRISLDGVDPNAARGAAGVGVNGSLHRISLDGVDLNIAASSCAVMSFGEFRFNDDGDAACPVNIAGAADLHLISLQADAARLKGGVAILSAGYDDPASPPTRQDMWQLNSRTPSPYVVNNDPANCPARWIKVSAEENGSFTITNVGNGFSKHYAAH